MTTNSNNNNDPPQSPQQHVMKAWTCHGHTQQELVENLQQAQIIKSWEVRQVMSEVDRSNYYGDPAQAFLDAPQQIGHGQTISAPHMHAHVLEEFAKHLSIVLEDPKNQHTPLNMLDVGCGSGYLTAAL